MPTLRRLEILIAFALAVGCVGRAPAVGEGEGEVPDDPSTWALIFSSQEFVEGLLTFDSASPRGVVAVNGGLNVMTERGENVSSASGAGCLALKVSPGGDLEWQRIVEVLPTVLVKASDVIVDALDRTWVACTVTGDSTTVDPDGFSLPIPDGGGFVARIDAGGVLEHVEADNATARALAAWPDGRVAIASAIPDGDIIVEWRDSEGMRDATVPLNGIAPFKHLSIEMFPVDDGSNDLLLTTYGAISPSALQFANGAISDLPSARALVARVSPEGVVWASAFASPTDSFPVVWLGRGAGRFVLAGSASRNALVDVLDGSVKLTSNELTSTGFAADLEVDGTVTNIARLSAETVAVWPARDEAARFVSVQFGDTSPGIRSAVSRIDAGSRSDGAVLSVDGGNVFAYTTVERDGVLLTSFLVDAASGRDGASIAPLVPDAVVTTGHNSYVVVRPRPWF